jgi:16S rRNA (guanine966-N2)-methyltransferase
MRIVAGAAKGRRLRAPREGTRPTSERAREALFNTLGDLEGLRVLELFAGSGALGLEALSRGASTVSFVEFARPACAVLRANIAAVDLPGAQLHCASVAAFLRRDGQGGPFDLVLADPPYSYPDAELAEVLADVALDRWLAPGGLVVVERSARSPQPPWPEQITPGQQRRYGDAALWYGHRR